MQAFNFHIPTRIVFGRGKISRLNDEIPGRAKKILIVTDAGLYSHTGIIKHIESILVSREVQVYHAIEENPTLASVERGYQVSQAFQPDYILGIGGGSAMDAAKGVANRVANPVRNPTPLMCIPTTAGTGSEVTPFAVFTDPENETKLGFSKVSFFPECALIDPDLMASMPEEVILNTGLDSLAHAVEAYLSAESFEMNDQIALRSARMVLDHLPKAITRNPESMDQMACSAMLSGIAIAHASTILPHIMGYPLTVYHNVPHGRAGIILLPALLDYLDENALSTAKTRVLDTLFRQVGGLRQFLGQLGVSLKLGDYGVQENQLENFVKKTIVKGDVAITPGKIDEQVILDLYRRSM